MNPQYLTSTKMADSMQTGKKFKWYHVLIGVFVLFILAIGGCIGSIFVATQGAVTEANDFFELLSTDGNNPGIAYEETSSEFQAYTSQGDFAAFVRDYPIVLEVESLSFDSRSIDSTDEYTVATLEGTMYGESGDTSPIAIQLVKEDGEWKVLFFSLEEIEDTTSYDEF